ncbi:hypothetical protein [uncultured Methylobacterium sp.]|uniref:hypothetical protein n=1 Tax=uncultured Methylobacterium sp. TaxID=157278 RepID=UPI0035CBA6BC
MPTYRAVVDEQGKVALPEELVRRLAIEAGEAVEFFLTLDGQVHFHVVNGSWDALTPQGPARRPPLSIREMDDAIADHMAEDDARIRRQSRPSERSAAE